MTEYAFTAALWEHEGPAAWHFVCLPEDVADEIDETFGHRARGFGAQRVEVTIGATRWSTSIFPGPEARHVCPPGEAGRPRPREARGRRKNQSELDRDY